ncbi:MAG: acyclic terpene utilization AtuA family protein [Sphaerochaetaceae bacterium]|nr:acyclic terpene utilization AtuA family protein [Sphaerochaetaceae bacterium]
MKPDAIIVDAGSTDAGPHKLGANVAIVSKRACKQDLSRIILGSKKLNIPFIIGSSGGSGAISHINWTLDIIDEIIKENNLYDMKQAIVYADINKDLIKENLKKGLVSPLGDTVPPLTEDILNQTNSVVAQMGVEPIIKAINTGAQIIVCGRAYDPAIFAAFGISKGFDSALSYHLGKILECGALCCDPGTTKDCMMGELHETYFDIFSTNEERYCSPTSVAAHTFYEKDHPYLLHGPGIIQDLSKCEFKAIDKHTVRVTKSKLEKTDPYKIKLEGARKVAYRTFVIAGIRDPLLINKLEEVEELVKQSVLEQYENIDEDSVKIQFYNYGKNGVMGDLETNKTIAHEIGVMFEVIAKTQDIASAICASLRSTFMHYGYEGRKSTAGNLAFPFAPSDVEFGAVYEFSVYHLMSVEDPSALFPIEIRSTKK